MESLGSRCRTATRRGTALNALGTGSQWPPSLQRIGGAPDHAGPTSKTPCSSDPCSTTGPADQHYDTVSGLHQVGARGSDPDAAVYWACPDDRGRRRTRSSSPRPARHPRPRKTIVNGPTPRPCRWPSRPSRPSTSSGCQRAVSPSPQANRLSGDSTQEQRRVPGHRQRNRGRPEDAQRTRATAPSQRSNRPHAARCGLRRRAYKYSHDYEGHFAPMQNLPGKPQGAQVLRPDRARLRKGG